MHYRFMIVLLPLFLLLHTCKHSDELIDRRALVCRHIPSVSSADSLFPFSVGNGEFAFTADITGLQTFPEFYRNGISLCTMSQWGWHSVANPNHYALDQTFEYYDTYGRSVPYASLQHSKAGEWLRANPHRLNLGRIGFKIKKQDGSEIKLTDIKNIHQTADIWEGIIKSTFTIENHAMQVETGCHPQNDAIAVKIRSKLLRKNCVSISFDFPYGSLSWGGDGADWNSPEKHTSKIIVQDDQSALIERKLDSTQYFVEIQWQGKAQFERLAEHAFLLSVSGNKQFSFTCCFSQIKPKEPLSNSEEVFQICKTHWQNFWKTGGAVDLSESKDSRAFELERRIVQSRYLTAIQCAGSLPPQETGLTCNSWYGKFHLEMHWWHAVHFALWGKPDFLEKSLSWYRMIFPEAGKTAQQQGYEGVRWPKMVGPDGRESPSTIGVFLIWQQPHPIYYAELLYQQKKDRAVLERYKAIVFASADFMADYARWDENKNQYVLGPPLIPAQEIDSPDSTINPTFELAYWAFGLKTAQKWRERLGFPPDPKWQHIIDHLSPLPMNHGLYQNAENALNTFEDEKQRRDHPTLLGAYGMLPNDSVDIDVMRSTLNRVMQSWDWESTWGWDYPLIAMTAARIGQPETAVDALLMAVPKNTYLNNGHNYQSSALPLYLPGNGGLLTAVAMMTAGWDGAPERPAPGFPKNGKWTIKYEGLSPLP